MVAILGDRSYKKAHNLALEIFAVIRVPFMSETVTIAARADHLDNMDSTSSANFFRVRQHGAHAGESLPEKYEGPQDKALLFCFFLLTLDTEVF